MTQDFSVEWPDYQWRGLIRDLEDVGPRAVQYAAMALVQQVAHEIPTDSGDLQASFLPIPVTDYLWMVRSNMPYALALYEGRKPGPAPFKPIAEWADRKGLPPGAVWASIVAHGTKPNPYADRAVLSTAMMTATFIARALNELT